MIMLIDWNHSNRIYLPILWIISHCFFFFSKSCI